MVVAGVGVHGQAGENLQHMVLQDVPDGSGLIIKLAPVLDPEVFRHGDLNTAHIVAVPDGLENGIGKAGIEDILHRLFAQIMVNAKNGLFGKILVQQVV